MSELSNKSRHFLIRHFMGVHDEHTWTGRIVDNVNSSFTDCKRCGRMLMINRNGDPIGSATKNQCLGKENQNERIENHTVANGSDPNTDQQAGEAGREEVDG
jgi:hypothetical protein